VALRPEKAPQNQLPRAPGEGSQRVCACGSSGIATYLRHSRSSSVPALPTATRTACGLAVTDVECAAGRLGIEKPHTPGAEIVLPVDTDSVGEALDACDPGLGRKGAHRALGWALDGRSVRCRWLRRIGLVLVLCPDLANSNTAPKSSPDRRKG
jgi:hypothetical protein